MAREKRGLFLARQWAELYGSSWIVSSDLMEGPWSDQATFQQCLRALNRANIWPERTVQDGRSYLYRLDPGVVVGLLDRRG